MLEGIADQASRSNGTFPPVSKAIKSNDAALYALLDAIEDDATQFRFRLRVGKCGGFNVANLIVQRRQSDLRAAS
jgi:hypothetical protein